LITLCDEPHTSYGRALACETCVNFKDQALQLFAGETFQEIQDAGNDIFDSLPAPKADETDLPPEFRRGHGHRAAPRRVDMSVFNCASGGCVAGDCEAVMHDGSLKPLHAVRAGDRVMGGHRVACVVCTDVGQHVKMVELPDLCITPWHPIREADTEKPEWVFPASLVAKPSHIEMPRYFNFVLESGHVLHIGDYDVCTLGHGFQDNAVIRHEYFGSDAVVQDLKQHEDEWRAGCVTLTVGEALRDPDSGLIVGL
jgi:hypothetical protein